MKKKIYLEPHMEVVDVKTNQQLLVGSVDIDSGDTGIIDGGGGDDPALSPFFDIDPDHIIFGF